MADIEPRYVSSDDAATRLNGTTVLYKYRPVHLELKEGYTYRVYPLIPSDAEFVPRSVNVNVDPHLSFDIPMLGYVNLQRGEPGWETVYVERMPYRRYQQGVCARNTVSYWEGDTDGRRAATPRGDVWADLSAIGKCITDQYPTFPEVISALSVKENLGMAFHKNFALSKLRDNREVVRLRHFHRTIGIVDYPKREILMLPNYRKFTPTVEKLTSNLDVRVL